VVPVSPPLRAGAPPLLRSDQPACVNIHDDGSCVPSAQTLPYSVPPESSSLNQYQAPTCQLKA